MSSLVIQEATERAAALRSAATAQTPATTSPGISGHVAAGVGSVRSTDVCADNPVPEPPFWGTRVIKGVPLAEYAAYLDERATFIGQWGHPAARYFSV